MRFGVIGTAHWARAAHVPGIRKSIHGELTGLWGRSPEKAREMAAELGVPAFDSLDALLDAVDAVTIAVPPPAQAEIALRAAAAGKHLILEKPVASDLSRAFELLQAVERANVQALVYLTRRFEPAIEQVLQAARGVDWHSAELEFHSDVMSVASPYRQSVWRQAPDAALWDLGPHALSVLMTALGAVTEIQAWRQDNRHVLSGRHAGGARSETSLTLRAAAGQRRDSCRLTCAAAQLSISGPSLPRPEGFAHAVDGLGRLAGGERPNQICDLRFGVEVVAVLEAARASLDSGAPEQVLGI